MGCKPFTMVGPGGEVITGIACGGRSRKSAPCVVCGAASSKLCDGRPPPGSKKKTCDAPLCAKHGRTYQIPAQLSEPDVSGWSYAIPADTRDYCQRHPDEEPMKALTIHAPWALLIVEGWKTIENRDWTPTLRQGEVFAIHQGKSYDQDAADFARGRGILVPTEEEMEALGMLGAVVGVAAYDDHVTHQDDLDVDGSLAWWRGPIAWRLRRPVKVKPIACRGMQKLWTLPSSVEATLRERLQGVSPTK